MGETTETRPRRSLPIPTHRHLWARWGRYVLLMAGAVLVVLLRFADLHAYPFFARDEGYWTNGVKLFLVLGRWGEGHFFQPYQCPTYSLTALAVFKVLGTKILWMRCFGGLCSLVTIGLTYWVARRAGAELGSGLLAAALLAVEPYTLTTFRRGYLEPSSCMWMMVAVAMWLSPSRLVRVGGGVPVGLAGGTKMHALLIAPALVLSAFWERGQGPRRLSAPLGDWALLLALAALTVCPQYLYFHQADPQGFATVWGFSVERYTLGMAEHGVPLWERPARNAAVLLARYPLLVPLGTVSLLWLLARGQGPSRLAPAWYGVMVVAFLSTSYFDGRHFTYAAPAACVLIATALHQWAQGSPRLRLAPPLLVALNLAMIGCHWALTRSTTPEQVEHWMTQHVDHGAWVMGPSHLCVSLPQPSIEYLGTDRHGYFNRAEANTREFPVTYVVADDVEGPRAGALVLRPTYAQRLARFGTATIYHVDRGRFLRDLRGARARDGAEP